jgi:hypothetical protein
MIRRWINRARTSRWWVKALTLTSKSEYGQALHYIRLIDRCLAGGEGQKYRFYRKLLEGYLLGGLGRRDEALEILSGFQQDILKLGFVNDELKYLKCYAAAVGNDILKSAGGRQLTGNEETLFPTNYDDIDLTKVPRNVRRYFPLRYHPRWNEVR